MCNFQELADCRAAHKPYGMSLLLLIFKFSSTNLDIAYYKLLLNNDIQLKKVIRLTENIIELILWPRSIMPLALRTEWYFGSSGKALSTSAF